MTPLPVEFQDLLKSFNAQDLEYMVVGGWAVGHHGYIRYTGDIDIWIAVSSENADRLIRSLMEFMGDAPTKQSIVKMRKTTEFGNPPLRVHVMCDISGVKFDSCFAQRIETEWGGIPVKIISFDALMKNKKASGRHKDLADVDYLTKHHKLAKRKNRK